MSCTNPLLAVDFGIDPTTGKHRLKLIPRRVDINLRSLEEKYGRALLRLPCGRCDACQLSHRKVWSVRCMLESGLYLQNSFITLTYDNEHYEAEKENRREDLQKFIHALRDAGYKFRYFACGEYGSTSGRFHYHMIMFNFFPPDAKPLGKKLDNMYYSSEMLSKYWRRGNVIVGQCTERSCSYVAGYTNKKSELGKQSFITMSNRPGIAYDYFLKHREEILKYDAIVGPNGSIYIPPKYADKVFDEKMAKVADANRYMRRVSAGINESVECSQLGMLHKEELIKSKEGFYRDKLNKKRRSFV